MGLDLILRYFPDLTDTQRDQFERMGPAYVHWNGQINVVSRKDAENMYERHILHSLAIAKLFRFQPGSQILDIGTGGGFPGVPLAVLHPDVTSGWSPATERSSQSRTQGAANWASPT